MMLEILSAAVVGLVAGSFLCLVAHRLPVIIEREWTDHCAATQTDIGVAGQPGADGAAPGPAPAPYNLFWPPSHCPACGHRLGIVENIPLLSWMLQRGRCRACGASIGWREPLVEVAAAVLAMLAVWRFCLGWDAALAAIFLWLLLLASVIDLQRGWLPDQVTQPMLWLGLLANLGGRFATPEDAVLGAVAGYLCLWLVYWGFRLATGREGMGIGDLHLLAAIGGWAGWQILPGLVLAAALLGLAWAAVACLAMGRSRSDPMPFGPMLAVGGLVALLWPDLLEGLFTHGLAP
jgi:leader peptidase (prepilin peptidase)/N-methyltransferase